LRVCEPDISPAVHKRIAAVAVTLLLAGTATSGPEPTSMQMFARSAKGESLVLVRAIRSAGCRTSRAWSRSAERLSSLKEQRAAKEGELEEGRERLVELRKSNQSRGLFSRVLRSAPSTEEAEAKLAGLEAELRSLDEEIERSQRARAAGEGDPALLEAQRKLEAARARLAELESAMQASLQLASEREAATKALAEAISAMGVDAGAAAPRPA
jgi:hypothetical protein